MSRRRLRAIPRPKLRPGYRLHFCRYRRTRNRSRILDAHAYGWRCWCFPVKLKK
jgi:hypothetical protein